MALLFGEPPAKISERLLEIMGELFGRTDDMHAWCNTLFECFDLLFEFLPFLARVEGGRQSNAPAVSRIISLLEQ